jgi:hypothetical protein
MSFRKVIKWCLIGVPLLLVLSVIVLTVGSCAPDMVANSWHLHQMRKELAAISTPSNTERLASRSAVGQLVGNGSHCDFFAGAVFHSTATPDAIRQHYAGQAFFNPITSKREEVTVAILTNQDGFDQLWLPYAFNHAGAWDLSDQTFTNGTVFIVEIMRSYKPNGDGSTW